MTENYDALEQKIGYTFLDKKWLRLALTHCSVGPANNQRLEFMGDALLDYIVADYLYVMHPDWTEKELTRGRAAWVSAEALLVLYDRFGLDRYLHTFNLSIKSLNVKSRSDVVEALIGAIYYDGGMVAVKSFVLRYVCVGDPVSIDYKSRLKERCDAQHIELRFVSSDSGKAGKDRFACTVWVADEAQGKGVGARIIDAEQDAAKRTLENW